MFSLDMERVDSYNNVFILPGIDPPLPTTWLTMCDVPV
jgi:hypothetical protein